MIPPISSIAQLQALAKKNPKYKELAILSSLELGNRPDDTQNLDEAIAFLKNNAKCNSEEALVEDINAIRDKLTNDSK